MDLARIGLQVVEQDDVAAFAADGLEEAADMFPETRGLVVEELAGVEAAARHLSPVTAVLDHPPGAL